MVRTALELPSHPSTIYLVNDRRLEKSVSAMLPPWLHSQKAGTILPTLMPSAPVMPPAPATAMLCGLPEARGYV